MIIHVKLQLYSRKIYHCVMFGIVFFVRFGKIAALALLLMHWDHLQFGLYFEIKLLDRTWFGKTYFRLSLLVSTGIETKQRTV